MENNLSYKVQTLKDKFKLRDYLKYEKNLSSRFIKNSGLGKRIKVNGNIEKLNYIVKEGDSIVIDLCKEEHQNITAEKMDIDIAYEDMDIIIVNKSPGIVVHPTKGHPFGTLSNGLMYHFQETGQKCIVRLVNRLDMDTSGLIIIAKNQHSHMALAKAMDENLVEKNYVAIVHGNLEEKVGTIDLPIGRPTEDSICRQVLDNGQRSITHYEVIQSFKDADLLKLRLETGRTHQIRVHLSHIGHAIYGDTLYGNEEKEFIPRQALHAFSLKFPHPKNGEYLKVESEMPKDMVELINMFTT